MAEKKSSTPKKAVYLEVYSQQYDMDKLMEKAVKDYKANNKAAIKDINLYVKPEDQKAYYTVNDGTVNGSIDL